MKKILSRSWFFGILLLPISLLSISGLCVAENTENVKFWNGNKTSARQGYEVALLNACLSATESKFGVANLIIDNTNYPVAADEGSVLDNGAQILVTIAGNVKFSDKNKIIIPQSLTKGLLGYRLLIVKDESLKVFDRISSTKDLRSLAVGIPATWGDAEIFRRNSYSVVEKGTYEDLFTLLKNGDFDYTTLGVNEIEEAFEQKAKPLGDLSIEPSVMVYYPFPLVFYVNSNNPALAKRIDMGLKMIKDSGEYEKLFDHYHGDVVARLGLNKRKIFSLDNPFLADELAGFKPTLLNP